MSALNIRNISPFLNRVNFLLILGAQNFDVIRFATYRTACKLRFVQKKTNCKYILLIYHVTVKRVGNYGTSKVTRVVRSMQGLCPL